MVLFKTLFFLAICTHQIFAALNQTWTHPSYPGYKITIQDLNSKIPDSVTNALRARFWAVYPKMVKDWNPSIAPKEVKFIYDPNHTDNPAECDIWAGTIRFNAKYMIDHPTDIDIVTHESFHLIQRGYGECPWYIVEGLADFARYRYGLSNSNTGWRLAPYNSNQNYDKGYTVTAALIEYMNQERFGTDPVAHDLFNACKDGSGYNEDEEDQVWNDLFGATISDWWGWYAESSQ